MAMFNSYVCLPEGNDLTQIWPIFDGIWWVLCWFNGGFMTIWLYDCMYSDLTVTWLYDIFLRMYYDGFRMVLWCMMSWRIFVTTSCHCHRGFMDLKTVLKLEQNWLILGEFSDLKGLLVNQVMPVGYFDVFNVYSGCGQQLLIMEDRVLRASQGREVKEQHQLLGSLLGCSRVVRLSEHRLKLDFHPFHPVSVTYHMDMAGELMLIIDPGISSLTPIESHVAREISHVSHYISDIPLYPNSCWLNHHFGWFNTKAQLWLVKSHLSTILVD